MPTSQRQKIVTYIIHHRSILYVTALSVQSMSVSVSVLVSVPMFMAVSMAVSVSVISVCVRHSAWPVSVPESVKNGHVLCNRANNIICLQELCLL